MKKFIIKSGAFLLSELSLIIILGLTPIFFNYFYPTNIDLNKLVIFKVFTLLLLFASVWRFSEFKLELNKNIWRRMLPFILLFIFLIVSLFFSVDIASSWIGSYTRHEGLISWLFYGLWTILVALHLGEGTEVEKSIKIKRLFIVASVSGFLVSVYAILQLFGLDFVSWSEPAKLTGRAVSSFGQPNYLACWLLIIIPLSAYLFYTAKNNLGKIIWSLCFIVEISALLATGSRAAFLTFLAVSVLWIFWFLAKKNILSRRKIFIIIFSSLVVALLFATFLAISNPNRFQEFTDLKKGSASVRLELWKSGFNAFLQKPLLGYGLENQSEVYVKYYKVDWALYGNPNTYSDRAHNLILDTLLTGGIIGLGIFIYFLRWVYLNLFRAFKDDKNRTLAAFLLWSLTAYLVSLLFNFSVTVTNIYFWLIVALSLIISGVPLLTFKTSNKNSELARLIVMASVLIIFFYGSITLMKQIEADYYYNKSLEAVSVSEYFTALVLKDYVNQTRPDAISSSFYNQGLSLRLIESLPKIKDKSSFLVVKQALLNMESSLPNSNFENKFVKAFTIGTLGKTIEAENMFNKLIALSPELPKVYLAWGDTLLFNHNLDMAKIKFEKSLSLLPEINNPYLSAQQKINLESYQTKIVNRLLEIKLLQK